MTPCHNKGNIFLVDDGEDRQAKAICKECSVQTKCLDRALRVGATYGVWAGVNFGDHKDFAKLPLSVRRRMKHRTDSTRPVLQSQIGIDYDGVGHD